MESDTDRSEPLISAAAPLRVSFVGGGTDFPAYYREHGGAVVSATINHRAYVSISPREDNRVRIRSLDLGHVVDFRLDAPPPLDGVMDLAKAAVRRFGVSSGIDMEVRSDAPAGSGLGGSSALTTAIAGGLAALQGVALRSSELAELCYAIEREDAGVVGGKQDQYAAAFGGFNLLEFSDAGVDVTSLSLSGDALAKLHEQLMLCYTGTVRTNLGLIDTQLRMFHEGREETLLGMKQLHELAYRMRDALEHGDVVELGALLDEAYASKKQMNPYIADETPIERLFALARDAGASGGKICGAGGGGYLLLACASERQGNVRDALEREGGQFASFTFVPEGVRATRDGEPWAPLEG
jgi:D-glycero-alpha-D-manno-heptose-7-phosphate kinase